MKKICIFCSLSSFGTGMPISTYKLAAGLADGKDAGVCVVLPEEGELAERLRGIGVDVGIVPFNRLKKNFWKRPWRLLALLSAGRRLSEYIRANGIDIVHFSDVIDAPFYPFARIAGAKAVAHVRVCVDAPAVRYLYRVWTHLFCSRIVTVSHFVKRRYGFGRKASVVYNPGPDRSIFNPERYKKTVVNTSAVDKDTVNSGGHCERSEAIQSLQNTNTVDTDVNDCPVVAAVSSFRRDKGLHNFVEIAAEIAKRRRAAGRRARFMIVGGIVSGHEEYYYDVIASARRAGLGETLTVTGNVKHEEVPALLSGASVLIHAPDWEEALGGVVLEAMAMGVAVVAYDSGGVRECFRNGISGYLVKQGDKTGAAIHTASLLNNPAMREAMIAKAQIELNEKFTQESYINNILAVYEKIKI
jgi:glycosyltransferase involved in cell wall biosynthesis